MFLSFPCVWFFTLRQDLRALSCAAQGTPSRDSPTQNQKPHLCLFLCLSENSYLKAIFHKNLAVQWPRLRQDLKKQLFGCWFQKWHQTECYIVTYYCTLWSELYLQMFCIRGQKIVPVLLKQLLQVSLTIKKNHNLKYFTILNLIWKELPHRVPTRALGAYLPQLASTLPSSSQCSSVWQFGSHLNRNNYVNLPCCEFHENASLPFQIFGAGASRARLHRNLPTSFSLGIVSK